MKQKTDGYTSYYYGISVKQSEGSFATCDCLGQSTSLPVCGEMLFAFMDKETEDAWAGSIEISSGKVKRAIVHMPIPENV